MKKSAYLLCLLLGLMSILLVPTVQAQQNVASNPLGCTLTARLDSGTPTTATTKVVSAATATSQQVYQNGSLVTVNTTKSIKICAFILQVKQGATPANFGLVYGTGGNCITGTTNLTPPFFGTASVIDSKQQEFGQGTFLIAPPGKDVCMKPTSAPTDMAVMILYKYE